MYLKWYNQTNLGFVQAKKHWRRKHHQHWSESNNKLSRKKDNLDVTNSYKDMETDIGSSSSSVSTNMTLTSISSESAAASSSSSSVSSLSSSRSFNSSSPYQSKLKSIDSALCLLLLTLLVVIVWGKVCAIVCTSTWLCIVFGRSNVEEQTQMSSVSDWREMWIRSLQKEDCIEELSTEEL